MPIRDIAELKTMSPAGVYCFSQTKPNERGLNKVKIGRTISCKTRLDSYHLCYNDGYYICGWLPLNAIRFDLNLPEHRAHALELTRKLESRMHAILESHQDKTTTRTRKSEWFKVSLAKLRAALWDVYAEFPQFCTYPFLEVWYSPPADPQEVQDELELDTQPEPPSWMPRTGHITSKGRVVRTPSKFRGYEFWT